MAKTFVSGYMIRNGSDTIGITTRTVVSGDNRHSTLIGFDIRPDPQEYQKFIILTGDDGLDSIILPDVNLLVKIEDIFKGKFLGIQAKREVKLRKHSTAIRNNKNIHVFLLERVSSVISSKIKDEDFIALKNDIGGTDWKENSRSASTSSTNIAIASDRNKKSTKSNRVPDSNINNSNVREITTNEMTGNKGEKGKEIEKGMNKRRKSVRSELLLTKAKFEEFTGNILQVDDMPIVQCISADVNMSKGLAKDTLFKYPGDKEQILNKNPRVGRVIMIKEDDPIRVYMITKKRFYEKPSMIDFSRCLVKLKELCDDNEIKRLAIPKLGCGLDKLNWDIVKRSIMEVFIDNGISISLYTLDENDTDEDENDEDGDEDNDNGKDIIVESEEDVCAFSLVDFKDLSFDPTLYSSVSKLTSGFDAKSVITKMPSVKKYFSFLNYEEVTKVVDFVSKEFIVCDMEKEQVYGCVSDTSLSFNYSIVVINTDGLESKMGIVCFDP